MYDVKWFQSIFDITIHIHITNRFPCTAKFDHFWPLLQYTCLQVYYLPVVIPKPPKYFSSLQKRKATYILCKLSFFFFFSFFFVWFAGLLVRLVAEELKEHYEET